MMSKVVCLTLDIEADFHNSRGDILLFEQKQIFKQYTDLINRHKAKVTAFLVTSILNRYEKNLRHLEQQIPIEYEVHSHQHDLTQPCSATDIIEASRYYQQFTGHKPMGYRAPVGQINSEGWDTLFKLGFKYDSSIYPSYRPGKLGYNHLKVPVSPFRVTNGKKSLTEFPFGSLSGLRLVFSLSYVKLLGWSTFKNLARLFPLPGQFLMLSHPYDFYFHQVQSDTKGWETPLLARNAAQAFDIYDQMLTFLHQQGYEFMFASELLNKIEKTDLPTFKIENL